MCKCIYLFILFAFIQIQLRWHRDEKYQWIVSLKGSSSCPVEFTESFVHGHPPLKIHTTHVEFFQDHQIFVYTNGSAFVDNQKIDVHTFVQKGSILKVEANNSIYIDIIGGIPYARLYK